MLVTSETGRVWALALFAIVALAASGSGVRAQDDASRAMARQLGAEGLDAFQANEVGLAELKLDRAFRLYATPTLGLWSARARQKAGHWVEAAERLREAMRASADTGDSATQRAAQRDAELELNALLPRIPSLTIEVQNAAARDTKLTLDGVALPSEAIGLARPTNPGKHQIVGTHAGEHIDNTLQLEEAEHKQLTLTFREAPQAPAASADQPPSAAEVARSSEPTPTSAPASTSQILRPISYVVMGLGVAGLAASGVTMLLAKAKREGCWEEAGTLMCPNDSQTNSYNAYRTISTVSFYAGSTLVVAGLITWLAAPSTEARPATNLSVSLGPSNLTLSGTF